MVNYMNTLRRTVSHSEVETYLSCERKHYYAYGLEITRKTRSMALSVGSFGHKALEVFFLLRQYGVSIKDAQEVTIWWVGREVAKHPEDMDVYGTALVAINFFFESGALNDLEILAVEREFVLEAIDETLDMPFVVDIIVRDKLGRIGVVDNKFLGRFPSETDMQLMPQLPKYAGSLRVLQSQGTINYQIDFVAYNILRTGGAKADTYKQRHWYTEVDMNDARIQRVFYEQYKASKRIQGYKQWVVDQGEEGMLRWSNEALRVFNGKVCDRCSFKALCIAELNNDAPSLVLDSDYMKKERREFVSNGK